MTNKERLEQLEGKYSILTITSKQGGIECTEVEVEDLVFLIQNGFKQAKRAEKLEENNRTFRKNNKRLRKENKRYREVLRFYADEKNYEDIGIPTGSNPPALPILEDRGEVARRELEGEE